MSPLVTSRIYFLKVVAGIVTLYNIYYSIIFSFLSSPGKIALMLYLRILGLAAIKQRLIENFALFYHRSSQFSVGIKHYPGSFNFVKDSLYSYKCIRISPWLEHKMLSRTVVQCVYRSFGFDQGPCCKLHHRFQYKYQSSDQRKQVVTADY